MFKFIKFSKILLVQTLMLPEVLSLAFALFSSSDPQISVAVKHQMFFADYEDKNQETLSYSLINVIDRTNKLLIKFIQSPSLLHYIYRLTSLIMLITALLHLTYVLI